MSRSYNLWIHWKLYFCCMFMLHLTMILTSIKPTLCHCLSFASFETLVSVSSTTLFFRNGYHEVTVWLYRLHRTMQQHHFQRYTVISRAHIERYNESQWKSSLGSSNIILSNVRFIRNRHFFYIVPKYMRLNSNADKMLNQPKVNTIFITVFFVFFKHFCKFFSLFISIGF